MAFKKLTILFLTPPTAANSGPSNPPLLEQISIKSNKLATELAKKTLDVGRTKFANGSITPTDLQLEVNTYLTNEKNYQDSKTQYFKDVMDLRNNMGDYLSVWHIKLRY